MNFFKDLFKSKPYYTGPVSDHFDGERFFNPWNPALHKFSDILRWKLTSKPTKWPKHVKNVHHDTPPAHVNGSDLRVTFIGHSTFLIQTQGLNILTDPVWSRCVSPFKRVGPKRVTSPGVTFKNLPKIDVILISHNHYDHLDLATINHLWNIDQPVIIAPLGNDTVINAKLPQIPIVTLDWEQSHHLKDNVEIHLQPAQHWSSRGLFDRNKALWGAFVIDIAGQKIYFSGDTGYGNGELFLQAAKKFGKFRLAFLPIGAYKPRWFMNYAHMDPEDAVKAHIDLGTPLSIAMHIQTFHLADEAYDEPKRDLAKALQKHRLSNDHFRILNCGQAWDIAAD